MEKEPEGDTRHLIAIAQLKARLSEVLRMVQAGRDIVLTERSEGR